MNGSGLISPLHVVTQENCWCKPW